MTLQQDSVKPPVEHHGRRGFLPMETNTFDRVFISVVCFVAISLFWLRFVEPQGWPLWISTIISILLGIAIVRNG